MSRREEGVDPRVWVELGVGSPDNWRSLFRLPPVDPCRSGATARINRSVWDHVSAFRQVTSMWRRSGWRYAALVLPRCHICLL